MIVTKYVVFNIIILIAERHLVKSEASRHLGRNQISPRSATFWPTRKLDSQINVVAGGTSEVQTHTQKPNTQELKQSDQLISHVTDSPEATRNDDIPPQSSGFWPDSKYVFKRRKNDQPNGQNVDDLSPNTQDPNANNNWQNWSEQSSDDTANQAIFIHYSGADKHKFSGNQNQIDAATNGWPELTTASVVLPVNPLPVAPPENPVKPEDLGISVKEITEIQKRLSDGWLGLRGIDPVILRLLQITPEDFEKEFGSLGSLPLPRDND